MIESVTDVRNAVDRAEREIYRANTVVRDMAYLCKGRLQSSSVDPSVLCALKKELANFNMHTGRWK